MLLECYDDYRPYLAAVLGHRRGANPRYSLRAFARDLAMSAPQLSDVLRGKKGLSAEAAARITERLRLDAADRARFLLLVAKSDARSPRARRLAEQQAGGETGDARFKTLTLEAYKVIADWYHYAILELTEIPGARVTPAAVASLLGIDTAVADEALQRLVQVGMLERRGGRWRKTDRHVTTTDGVASAAIRETTRQLLAKAGEALDEQEVAERDFSTVTFAIDPARLPEARKLITQFRRQMIALLERPPQSQLYCLAVQLFRLTRAATKEDRGPWSH